MSVLREWTHDDLVALAAKWLRRRMPVVITELATGGEEPDAIGFNPRATILVECKASRADFLSDNGKLWRQRPDLGFGMGDRRYYLTPKDMVAAEELPERWGLLWALPGGRIREELAAACFPGKDSRREHAILVSALRRLGQTCPDGLSVKAYTYQTKCRATVGVAEAEGDEA